MTGYNPAEPKSDTPNYEIGEEVLIDGCLSGTIEKFAYSDTMSAWDYALLRVPKFFGGTTEKWYRSGRISKVVGAQ